MEDHIWKYLIQMLSFRNDLINTLKPFFEELNNNIKKEKYIIKDKKYIPFLKSLNNFELEVLHKYKIITEETYANIAPKSNISFLIPSIIEILFLIKLT